MRKKWIAAGAAAVVVAGLGAGVGLAIAGGEDTDPSTGVVTVELKSAEHPHARAADSVNAKPKKGRVKVLYFAGTGTIDTAVTQENIDVRLTAGRCPRVIEGGVITGDPGVVQQGTSLGSAPNEYHVYLRAQSPQTPVIEFASHLVCLKGAK